MIRVGAGVATLLSLVACGEGGSPSPTASPSRSGPPASGPARSVRFTVDSGASRHSISPFIYGTNQADWNGRHRGLRLGRLGGNRWTAYNWETNASNAGSDFRHQNDDFLGGGEGPGQAVRPHVAAAHAAGASMIVTVPMAGYVSADKNPPGDVNQTPSYLDVRFHESQPAKPGAFSYPPNADDRVVYQDEFVAWLESTFAYARQDPSRTLFYALDNEPDLWAFTHARLRPHGAVTYAEIVERTVAWASAIKDVSPQALIFGPVSYGWQGFVRLQDAPDAGGRDFLDYYLDALRGAEARTGRRLVDVLDVHWYPEARGGNVRITEADASVPVASARVQAPRSLWDPGYVEASWISEDAGVGAIRLLPRLQEKIAARYPGTRLAITEYNYGAAGDISGGVAEADVLGIFGREDLFASAWWETGSSNRFVDAAFAAYCNFDGAGGRFGDTSVAAATSDHVTTSIYASVDADSDERVVLVALNKGASTVDAELIVTHAVSLTRGRVWRVTAASPGPTPGPELTATARDAFSLSLPPMSVTTVLLFR